MNSKTETTTNEITLAGKIISWLFGLSVLAAGIVNTFWGKPVGFGIFLILLSFIYFLPVNTIFRNMTGYSIPGMRVLRILLGMFIIWAALGVGDLFDKIEVMKMDL
ncbi:MAG TPA: hypothetical protein VF622_16495 [Segetibacter sp.]|jgi:uncharacterized membrane protein